MSEYAEISVERLDLWWFRNYLDSSIVSLFFSKRDLHVTPDCKIDEEDEEAGTYIRYVYKTSVKKAKERFDSRGFGLHNLERMFNDCLVRAIDYSCFLYHLRIDYDEDDKRAEERIRKNVSFKKWKNAMKKIVGYELANGNIGRIGTINDVGVSTECDKVIYYALKDEDAESFYAIRTEVIDKNYILRLILEFCNEESDVILDFSNLDLWADDCIPRALAATENVEKTIVLVEGTSDKDMLEFAIMQLYPHLADLFYFMDFSDDNGGKRDGGTSFVIKNLKTFYFSKIKSNFIAIFDNDAEGYASRCILYNEVKKWPDNFRILLYPEIDLFQKYPTIAPNGTIMEDDINKKAASIELYLPDSIIQSDGNYYPIEWEARRRIKQDNGSEIALYQGVISHKDDIKHKFHEVRKKIENENMTFVPTDWERMKRLLETIVFAFNN